MPIQKTSTLFCEDDADVTFISSDNVVFKIHSIHLNLSTSTGFARTPGDTTSPTGSEAVHLQEPAAVLEIIFQFIKPPPLSRDYKQPSIFDLDVELFFGVAEAIEKYVIYGPLHVCLVRMKQLVNEHPLEVLNHCILHGHTDLADTAAQLSLSHPMDEVIQKLTAPGLLPRFIIYHERWTSLGQIAAEFLFVTDCPREAMLYKMYRLQLDKDPTAMDKIPALPKGSGQCPLLCACHRQYDGSLAFVGAMKQMAKFSALKYRFIEHGSSFTLDQ
ncbi:hypothetical protein BDN70DRAFT_887232 [Pholiota conissans]|uniref:BTB domain-containing protein n=1 Tax=Pholiota conissans TaxID=109636 RepID=A0A9P6CSL8_9AGAR|nr:hypothetical protein BDN70DRAFT_887232 [Pholiota conissans]